MEKDERDRILSKVLKCFEMSKSNSPHEAAVAIRQAQKLMDKHGISRQEVGLAHYDSEKISVPLQVVKGPVPIILARVCNLIAGVFGCQVVTGSEMRVSDYSYYVEYFGRRQDVVIAGYTHAVVWKAMHKAWTDYKKSGGGSSGRGERMSFMVAWLTGVRQKVEMMVLDPQEEADITRKLLEAHPNVEQAERRKINNLKPDSALAGLAAAQDFSLHRPIATPSKGSLR